jgi:phosphohistidine phosphatase
LRRLIIFRHAHALKPVAGQRDFDRALSERGRRDAALMGAALAEVGLAPDLALVSPALRTRQTWEQAAAAFAGARVELTPSMYDASADQLAQIVQDHEHGDETVMLVGHNPGVHELAAGLLHIGSASPSVIAKVGRGFPTASAIAFAIDAAGRPSYDGLFLAADFGGGGAE